MMNFTKIVFESKDIRAFQQDLKDLVNSDSKARNLLNDYRKNRERIVDYVDYLMSKHDTDIERMMNDYNIDYEEAVDLIAKGF
jgi:uncharacterized protein YllA (UPF0747 family)